MVVSSIFAFASITASADSFDYVIESKITHINNEKLVGNYSFVMHLSKTDFMTAQEWDTNDNYKWYNAEEHDDYAMVDLLENNLCNFPLDKNLSDFNFEQKILIDGVPLAEYKLEHPYTLSGNKRTRVDTISIDFVEPLLKDIQYIEILEGCQFPTLARGCVDMIETSCIEITEGVKYENRGGTWVLHFEGWQEGKEYNGDEKVFYLSSETTYKGHDAVPLYEYTDFFSKFEVGGESYDGKALASSGNTQKDYITVLRLVNPISATEFNQINLRVYSNHKRTLYSYNDNGISTATLGNALESFTLGGAVFTTLNLTSSLYADADGMVRTIVFRFNEDGEPYVDPNGNHQTDANGNLERDQLFFISFNLANRDNSELLTKDSFIIVDNGDAYDITFRFNKACQDMNVALDTSKVTLNGQTLNKLLAECKTAKAKWTIVGLVCQIDLTLPKSYNGVSQIKNADNNFDSNNMGVLAGLAFPDGTTLDKAYTCHIYASEKILDSEVPTNYEQTKVLDITYEFVKDSRNLHFKIRFDKKITSANYYHACEIERWRENDLYQFNSLYYDSGMSKVFVKNGFKSSLLDSIVINGKTIGEWHAHDVGALTNIQTHYGASGLEYVDVNFESTVESTYGQLVGLANDGNGITIEIKEGLKFMTNCSVQKTQTFVLENGVFNELQPKKAIHVYYDGSEISNGAIINVSTAVDPASVSVDGVEDYSISYTVNGNETVFNIKYTDGSFGFTVYEDSVEIDWNEGIEIPDEQESQSSSDKKSGGCKSAVELPAIGALLLVAVAVITLKERRKYE